VIGLRKRYVGKLADDFHFVVALHLKEDERVLARAPILVAS
jgi:hypothetical protein